MEDNQDGETEDMECLPWERMSECSDNEAEMAKVKLVVANEKKRLT